MAFDVFGNGTVLLYWVFIFSILELYVDQKKKA